MRQRAVSVDLHPEIEDACLSELGEHCSDDEDDAQKGGVSIEFFFFFFSV
jgi:hypothetical protein